MPVVSTTRTATLGITSSGDALPMIHVGCGLGIVQRTSLDDTHCTALHATPPTSTLCRLASDAPNPLPAITSACPSAATVGDTPEMVGGFTNEAPGTVTGPDDRCDTTTSTVLAGHTSPSHGVVRLRHCASVGDTATTTPHSSPPIEIPSMSRDSCAKLDPRSTTVVFTSPGNSSGGSSDVTVGISYEKSAGSLTSPVAVTTRTGTSPPTPAGSVAVTCVDDTQVKPASHTTTASPPRTRSAPNAPCSPRCTASSTSESLPNTSAAKSRDTTPNPSPTIDTCTPPCVG